MALLVGRRPKERPPYLRRTLLEYNWKGKRVLRTFPRSRKRRTGSYEKSLQSIMATVMGFVGQVQEIEKAAMRAAIATQNRKFGGLKGSASIRLRDIEYQRFMGRLFTFELEGYGNVYSFAAHQDINDTLEWITSTPGSLLTRGTKKWTSSGVAPLGYPYTFG